MKKLVCLLIFKVLLANDYDLGFEIFKNIDFTKEPIEYENDLKQVYNLWSKACKNKNMQACYDLGFLYESGIGTKQNYTKAINLYTKACENNLYEACYAVGFMNAYGIRTQQNKKKAIKFYTKSCNHNYAVGCYFLSFLYKDKKAKEYLKKACDLGDERACKSIENLKN
ncbi:sel1 repeat family protein [Campylobacter sp. RM12642]|uniref:tetratricopeptide repeat protein n=1 Tax=unclassified Campylobacter TaxID=2593542 RepID=UPI001D890406|nr:sel1 repeat family protein [Campylobacter sp. RM12642]MBZ8007066.1 sel1 repeat family protein [Campylobacter sp. RM9334]